MKRQTGPRAGEWTVSLIVSGVLMLAFALLAAFVEEPGNIAEEVVDYPMIRSTH